VQRKRGGDSKGIRNNNRGDLYDSMHTYARVYMYEMSQ
jgi:hypothetical protein